MKKLLLLSISLFATILMHAAEQSPAEKLGWKLAIHSYTFQKFPIFDSIDKTAALGVKYMSISGSLILNGTNRVGTVGLSDKDREAIDKKLQADGFGHFLNIGVVQLPADEAKSRQSGGRGAIRTHRPRDGDCERLHRAQRSGPTGAVV